MTKREVAPFDLLLSGGTVLTMNATGEIFPKGYVGIRDGKIASIGKSRQGLKAKKTIKTDGCIVMPGLVNGHTHTGMTLLRGIGDDLPLYTWLHEKIFPLERKWGKTDFVYMGTLLASLEMIQCGTTLFNDMYYFEEAAAKAVNEAGLRAVCGQTIVDISGVEDSSKLIEMFESYREKVKKFSLVIPAVAPHSIYGVGEKSWPVLIDYAEKHQMPLHIHLAEMQEEQDECLKKRGITPTEFFENVGLWSSSRAIAAHAVCISKKDIQILGKHKVGIAHNPESNMKLGTKICPVAELREAGAHVVLGTDGTASNNDLNLFGEADSCAKLQVLKYGVGRLKAYEIVRMLTIEGAMALGQGAVTGSLEVGKSADVIAVNTERAHAVPMYDPYSHLIYSACSDDVLHTIVNGKILMQDRKVKSLDEQKIIKDAVRWGQKILKG